MAFPPGFDLEVVVDQPRISLAHNFLTDEEIKHVLSLPGDQWAPCDVDTVVGGARPQYKHGTSGMQNQHRTSNTYLLDNGQTPIVQRIEERLARLTGLSVDHLERLAMLRYEPGQYFKIHHDGAFRLRTVFLYLNDLPDGDEGETHFPNLGLKMAPRKGTAAIWSNRDATGKADPLLLHEGLPPKTSIKYGVNCFFHEDPVRVPKVDTAHSAVQAPVTVPSFAMRAPAPAISQPAVITYSHPQLLSQSGHWQFAQRPPVAMPLKSFDGACNVGVVRHLHTGYPMLPQGTNSSPAMCRAMNSCDQRLSCSLRRFTRTRG